MADDAPRHLLVVDDDQGIRDLLEGFLTQMGYLVTTAVDGEEALRFLRVARFDMVLLDLSMPGTNGWDVRREMLADPALAAVPTIVMTAWADPEYRHLPQAVSYLLKPIDVAVLLRLVKEHAG